MPWTARATIDATARCGLHERKVGQRHHPLGGREEEEVKPLAPCSRLDDRDGEYLESRRSGPGVIKKLSNLGRAGREVRGQGPRVVGSPARPSQTTTSGQGLGG